MRRFAAAAAVLATATLVQGAVINPLTAPVPVSLPLVIVVAVALVEGPGSGLAFGFAAGLLADLASTHAAGVLALTWGAAGLIAGLGAGGRSVRGDAVTAAVLAAAGGVGATAILAVLHAEPSLLVTGLRDAVPAVLGSAVLAFAVVPASRVALRTQVLRAPEPLPTRVLVHPGRAGRA